MNKEKGNSVCGRWIGVVLIVTQIIALLICFSWAFDKVSDLYAQLALCGTLLIGVLILTSATIHFHRDYFKAYFEYTKAREETKAQEYKFSNKLIDLIGNHVQISEVIRSEISESQRPNSSIICFKIEIHHS